MYIALQGPEPHDTKTSCYKDDCCFVRTQWHLFCIIELKSNYRTYNRKIYGTKYILS